MAQINVDIIMSAAQEINMEKATVPSCWIDPILLDLKKLKFTRKYNDGYIHADMTLWHRISSEQMIETVVDVIVW